MSEITPEVLVEPVEITPRTHVVGVSLMKLGKLYPFDFSDFLDLQRGDRVIVETHIFGHQIGEVKRFIPNSEVTSRHPVQHITRLANPADLLTQQQWREREVPVLIECRERAKALRQYEQVKFVSAEYNFDGSRLTIFFTCDDYARIDTHPLRTALQRQVSGRVEFRQIGSREVAKLQGGLGACGIPRCCSTFLNDFSVITITMAKAQGISLSPAELTGMCGRLRCCLIYEYEQYVEARRLLPRIRKRVGTPHGEGRVVDVHPMQDAVTVKVDEEFHLVQREDLIPLQELGALKKAAASPCSKNEEGGCDCGAKRPRGSSEELLAEMGIADVEGDWAEEEDEEAEEAVSLENLPPAAPKPPKKRRRNRREPTEKASAADSTPAAEQPDQPRRNRRRRRRPGNRHDNPPQN